MVEPSKHLYLYCEQCQTIFSGNETAKWNINIEDDEMKTRCSKCNSSLELIFFRNYLEAKIIKVQIEEGNTDIAEQYIL